MRALFKKVARSIAGREIDQLRRTADDAAASREIIARLDRELGTLLRGTNSAAAPEVPSNPLLDDRFSQLNHELVMLRREMQILARTLTLPAPELWDQGTRVKPASAPPMGVLPNSTLCRQSEMETDWYAFWAYRMAHTPRYHRKLWEFVFIAQVLYERGQLAPGKHGLGFGVGKEPLAALFASYGAAVTGTDMPYEGAVEAGWATHNQHAAGKAQMRYPTVCSEELFETNVTFETFDMTQTPGPYRDLDFCWSSCALEHLGSIDAGLTFIERSIDCLKPGGVAVHTTEFNLTSNDETIESGGTVLFRKRDFEAVVARLEAAGHHVAPLDLRPGAQPVERYVDMAP